MWKIINDNIIFVCLFCCCFVVAVLEIVGPRMRNVIEGNFDSTTPQVVCLTLRDVKDGLRRDVLVQASGLDNSATST